ncbi:uncharacterized protein LOC115244302 isoform X2 [Formica exsecta]|uniref:uncharacterized protein LOC115244302 isoform X2 n=1 Tax=Formica exsecta TaxID=72781 RepID=UPI001142216C|nr:uncharacterized protein LOC115244302 isoform X2 [Formica exsecta]XP_029677731.1 uncharacterized protein LOC115244302 isoform X2 [Formica exsecta]
MPHCTTNFAWYLGKFIIGFTAILYLYVGLLKENEKSCVCDARMRELLRQESEKRADRCGCAKGMRNIRYACGCNKPTRLLQDDDCMIPVIANEYNKDNCARSRCCIRRNSN